jgi:hypothetical protein
MDEMADLSLRRAWTCAETGTGTADPWGHPALARMTERELADLPFPRQPDITDGDGPCAR